MEIKKNAEPFHQEYHIPALSEPLGETFLVFWHRPRSTKQAW